MIKFKQGSVTNTRNGKTADIIVKAITPNSIKDMLIGGGIMLIGVAYLTVTAFKKGSIAFEEAEMTTFENCDLIED